jgi:hypothetical protein
MQEDGNFVVYNSDQPLWSSETNPKSGKFFTLQGDGNLVIYQGEGQKAVWSPNIQGKGATELIMQDDGNLVAYAPGKAVWDSNTVNGGGASTFNITVSTPTPTATPKSTPKPTPSTNECLGVVNGRKYLGAKITNGQRINADEYIASANKKFVAIMQGDGNFVVYNSDQPLWNSETNSKDGQFLILQSDGNVVIYTNNGTKAVWDASTWGKRTTELIMQDDGNLVAYASAKAVWASDTVNSGGASEFNITVSTPKLTATPTSSPTPSTPDEDYQPKNPINSDEPKSNNENDYPVPTSELTKQEATAESELEPKTEVTPIPKPNEKPLATPVTSANTDTFTKTAAYDNRFRDIRYTDWFYNNAISAYEFGLIQGTSSTQFDPQGEITLGMAVTIAARINSLYYTGEDTIERYDGGEWFSPYVDYAVKYKIIDEKFTTDRTATRRDFAMIMAKALPDEALKEINDITDGAIPDMTSATSKLGTAVYKLYRAGILTGNEQHEYNADSAITRAETAANVSRMADPSTRQSLTL